VIVLPNVAPVLFSSTFIAQPYTLGGVAPVAPSADVAFIEMFHPLSAYGAALFNAGSISVNPIGQSLEEPISLAALYPNIQNFGTFYDANGDLEETGTIPVVTLGAPISIVVGERSSQTNGVSFSVTEQSASSSVSQTESINPQGVLTLDSVVLSGPTTLSGVTGVTIQSSLSDPIALNAAADGSLLVGVPSQQPGDEVTVVANANGDAIDVGGDSSSSSQAAIDFLANGLSGDSISIADTSSGVVDITTDISNGDTAVVASDDALSDVSEDLDFAGTSGTLTIDSAVSFSGTISNFLPGDTIDLAGIGIASGATLGANNVLTVSGGTGGTVTLNLDPTQDYSDVGFASAQDGTGGTDVSPIGFKTIDDPNGTGTGAGGINDAGQIVGYAYGDPSGLGFVDTGGSFTTVDDPNGIRSTYPVGINDAAQIAGFYVDAHGKYHGFLDTGGSFTTIDDPSATYATYPYGTLAFGINDAGQIVGVYADASGAEHGFVDTGGSLTTIDDPNGNGYTKESSGINRSIWAVSGMDRIVPLPVELIPHDIDLGHLLI